MTTINDVQTHFSRSVSALLCTAWNGKQQEFVDPKKAIAFLIKNDEYQRSWIIDNALRICARYSHGELTIRGLHYQLVNIGMTNTMQHYGRVKSAMVKCRREGLIEYEQFADHDRQKIGTTSAEETTVEDKIGTGTYAVEYWLKNYSKNRWENQEYYPEVWIEKKALQGQFESVCSENAVALCPCKGYPSLTFLNQAAIRFIENRDEGKKPIILYFGDYDASGEDIPRSIEENLLNDFGVKVEVRRILLMEDQVIEMGLPPAPTKATDSRAVNWDGLGQVELDAVPPETIKKYCREAIDSIFDDDLFRELIEQTKEERVEYRAAMKKFVEEYEFDD